MTQSNEEPRLVVVDPEGQQVVQGPGGPPGARDRARGPRGRDPAHRAGRAAGQGHADRQHDQAAARGGPAAPLDEASRARLRDIHRALDHRARGRPGARAARRAGTAVPAVHRDVVPSRRRAADRPGPAGRLARGAVPRHPDDAVRPADGRPVRSSRRCVGGAAAGPGAGEDGPTNGSASTYDDAQRSRRQHR